MAEVNLLRRYPVSKRNISQRSEKRSEESIAISREYGYDYFDGSRDFGYGGYKYDGRWLPIAEDIIEHYNLKDGDKVLDIGCAKGFLVKDIMLKNKKIECFGIDISKYALQNCEEEVVGRLHLGNMLSLPFPDASFDATICINTLHNLKRDECIEALKEIKRVTKNDKAYIQVDSYNNEEEKRIFESWVLTAYTHYYPSGWKNLFEEAGFEGDYYWTFIG